MVPGAVTSAQRQKYQQANIKVANVLVNQKNGQVIFVKYKMHVKLQTNDMHSRTLQRKILVLIVGLAVLVRLRMAVLRVRVHVKTM
jgi:hypothetical protein